MQVTPLFREAKSKESTRDKLRLLLEKAKANKVHYAARNHYCKMLISEMRQEVGAAGSIQAIRQKAIGSHSKLYDRLPPADQVVLREQAEREKRRRVEQLDAEVDRSADNLRAHIATK